MKSQRRHELQHNTLDTELGKIIQFFRTHANRILWGVLVVAAIALGVVYLRNRSIRQEQALLAQYESLQRDQMPPEERIQGYESLMVQDANERIAAMSAIHAAELYAVKALLAGTAEDRLQANQQAERLFRRAAEDYPGQKLATAKGHFGLAKQAENRGDWEAARAAYQAAQAVDGISRYPVAVAAKQGEEALKYVSAPPRLATVRPATAPATAPADESEVEPEAEPEMVPDAEAEDTAPADEPAADLDTATQPAE